jgi:hypothetical protein
VDWTFLIIQDIDPVTLSGDSLMVITVIQIGGSLSITENAVHVHGIRVEELLIIVYATCKVVLISLIAIKLSRSVLHVPLANTE